MPGWPINEENGTSMKDLMHARTSSDVNATRICTGVLAK
jgi:hypothetical protein